MPRGRAIHDDDASDEDTSVDPDRVDAETPDVPKDDDLPEAPD